VSVSVSVSACLLCVCVSDVCLCVSASLCRLGNHSFKWLAGRKGWQAFSKCRVKAGFVRPRRADGGPIIIPVRARFLF
jgi:hypothetical protein